MGLLFFRVQVQGMGEDQDPSPVRHGPAKLIPGQASIPDGEEGSADAANAAGAHEDSRRSLDSPQGQGSVAGAPPSVDDGGEEILHSTSAPRENDTSAPGEEESVREISVEDWRRHRTRDLDREGRTKTGDADGQNDRRPNKGAEKTDDLCETGQECTRKEALPELDPLPGA
jgi:hypothetical protein